MACTATETQQGFKCTSGDICYSCNSAATDALFKRLQAAINQFAGSMIFTPIKVDGVIGPGTTTHTKLVLSNLSNADSGVVGSSARALNDGIFSPPQLAASAQVVTDLLVLAGKQMGAPAPTPIPPAQPSPSVATLATTEAKKPPSTTSPQVQAQIKAIQASSPKLSASLLDRMPPWLAYVGGGLLAAGAIAAVAIGMKKRRGGSASPPAVAGRWYR